MADYTIKFYEPCFEEQQSNIEVAKKNMGMSFPLSS